MHWPKEKVQKDKQRSTKNTHKTKDRVTRTPLKTGEPRDHCLCLSVRFPTTTNLDLVEFNSKFPFACKSMSDIKHFIFYKSDSVSTKRPTSAA